MNKYLALLFVIINLLPVSLSCEIRKDLSGTISDSLSIIGSKCWIIEVPVGSYARINVQEVTSPVACIYAKLEISVPGTGDSYTVCPRDPKGKLINGLSDVNITLISKTLYKTAFTLNYTTETFACINKNHFRCSEHVCIPESKVCDGVKDCPNGVDEEGCGTGIASIGGVNISRENGVKWLNSKRMEPSGWGLNTPRAVIALYLANETYFNTREPEKELIVKQLALQTTLTLVNHATDPISVNELSMFINALIVTCHDPENFYKSNLLQTLSNQVTSSGSVSAAAYLALCNANWKISSKEISSLFEVLSKELSPSFALDVKAMTVMAITCIKNRANGFAELGVDDAETKYMAAVNWMISSQLANGSFGNPYTTALVTQALLSAAQENNKSWNLRSTVQKLMDNLNSPSVDLLLTYFTLPIFNSKSLTNIAAVNCPELRKPDFAVIADVVDKFDDKMDVHNSPHNGDHKAAIRIRDLETLGSFIHKVTSAKKKKNWPRNISPDEHVLKKRI